MVQVEDKMSYPKQYGVIERRCRLVPPKGVSRRGPNSACGGLFPFGFR